MADTSTNTKEELRKKLAHMKKEYASTLRKIEKSDKAKRARSHVQRKLAELNEASPSCTHTPMTRCMKTANPVADEVDLSPVSLSFTDDTTRLNFNTGREKCTKILNKTDLPKRSQRNRRSVSFVIPQETVATDNSIKESEISSLSEIETSEVTKSYREITQLPIAKRLPPIVLTQSVEQVERKSRTFHPKVKSCDTPNKDRIIKDKTSLLASQAILVIAESQLTQTLGTSEPPADEDPQMSTGGCDNLVTTGDQPPSLNEKSADINKLEVNERSSEPKVATDNVQCKELTPMSCQEKPKSSTGRKHRRKFRELTIADVSMKAIAEHQHNKEGAHTLIEGLIYPVEYYVRQTRSMTSNESSLSQPQEDSPTYATSSSNPPRCKDINLKTQTYTPDDSDSMKSQLSKSLLSNPATKIQDDHQGRNKEGKVLRISRRASRRLRTSKQAGIHSRQLSHGDVTLPLTPTNLQGIPELKPQLPALRQVLAATDIDELPQVDFSLPDEDFGALKLLKLQRSSMSKVLDQPVKKIEVGKLPNSSSTEIERTMYCNNFQKTIQGSNSLEDIVPRCSSGDSKQIDNVTMDELIEQTQSTIQSTRNEDTPAKVSHLSSSYTTVECSQMFKGLPQSLEVLHSQNPTSRFHNMYNCSLGDSPSDNVCQTNPTIPSRFCKVETPNYEDSGNSPILASAGLVGSTSPTDTTIEDQDVNSSNVYRVLASTKPVGSTNPPETTIRVQDVNSSNDYQVLASTKPVGNSNLPETTIRVQDVNSSNDYHVLASTKPVGNSNPPDTTIRVQGGNSSNDYHVLASTKPVGNSNPPDTTIRVQDVNSSNDYQVLASTKPVGNSNPRGNTNQWSPFAGGSTGSPPRVANEPRAMSQCDITMEIEERAEEREELDDVEEDEGLSLVGCLQCDLPWECQPTRSLAVTGGTVITTDGEIVDVIVVLYKHTLVIWRNVVLTGDWETVQAWTLPQEEEFSSAILFSSSQPNLIAVIVTGTFTTCFLRVLRYHTLTNDSRVLDVNLGRSVSNQAPHLLCAVSDEMLAVAVGVDDGGGSAVFVVQIHQDSSTMHSLLTRSNVRITSLLQVEGATHMILSTTCHNDMLLWCSTSGELLADIPLKLPTNTGRTSCIKATTQAGLLFVVLVFIGAPNNQETRCPLGVTMVINPQTGKMIRLVEYKRLDDTAASVGGAITHSNSLLATLSDGGMYQWDLFSGNLMNYLSSEPANHSLRSIQLSNSHVVVIGTDQCEHLYNK